MKLKENCYNSQVKQNRLKSDYSRTMNAWATNGFTRVPRNGSPDIIKEFSETFRKRKGEGEKG